jgi:hypothetical protein
MLLVYGQASGFFIFPPHDGAVKNMQQAKTGSPKIKAITDEPEVDQS